MIERIKDFFFKNFTYKAIALFISLFLWLYVNLGTYVPVTLYKEIKVKHKLDNYTYIVEPQYARITVLSVNRFIGSKRIKDVKAYVDGKYLHKGINKALVDIESPLPFFIKPYLSDPEYVKVIVKEK